MCTGLYQRGFSQPPDLQIFLSVGHEDFKHHLQWWFSLAVVCCIVPVLQLGFPDCISSHCGAEKKLLEKRCFFVNKCRMQGDPNQERGCEGL